MNTAENQTSTTEQHKQAKSTFSSNINHNEHQSRSTEQQIYHSHVWIFPCVLSCLRHHLSLSVCTWFSYVHARAIILETTLLPWHNRHEIRCTLSGGFWLRG